MKLDELVKYWKREEQAAKMTGWDFSHIAGRFSDGDDDLGWDFKSIVCSYLHDTDELLDTDTGGGEFLMSLGHPHEKTSATEGWPPNVRYCKEHLIPLGIDFRAADDPSALPFPDAKFDIMINRHGEYDPKEVYRVLKPGGVFLTQQVGEENDRALITRLLPDAEKTYPGHNLRTQTALFRDAGFIITEQAEAFRPIRFFDTGALVWFAKIIEWEFTGFSVDRCITQLADTEREIRRSGAVSGEIHRFYFVAQKPARGNEIKKG